MYVGIYMLHIYMDTRVCACIQHTGYSKNTRDSPHRGHRLERTCALVTVPCKVDRPFPSSMLGPKDWQLASSLPVTANRYLTQHRPPWAQSCQSLMRGRGSYLIARKCALGTRSFSEAHQGSASSERKAAEKERPAEARRRLK